MRINVYNEELTGEIERVAKTADTGSTFYGVRILLASAPELHHGPSDDDRSAITFWLDSEHLAEQFARALTGLA